MQLTSESRNGNIESKTHSSSRGFDSASSIKKFENDLAQWLSVAADNTSEASSISSTRRLMSDLQPNWTTYFKTASTSKLATCSCRFSNCKYQNKFIWKEKNMISKNVTTVTISLTSHKKCIITY